MRLLLSLLLLTGSLVAQPLPPGITVADIYHFWEAYDSLATTTDSVATLQRLYLDRGTPGLRAFVAARGFTAPEYVRAIREAPAFWASVRARTLTAPAQAARIEAVYAAFRQLYPRFRAPEVCFAIGCLRTAGTVSDGYLLIGAEMATADSLTDTHELSAWLRRLLAGDGDVIPLVAHETVHHLQPRGLSQLPAYLRHRLLMAALREGAADFVAYQVIGRQVNPHLHTYGDAHEAALWARFQADMYGNAYGPWLYSGNRAQDQPADMGYYLGYRIIAAYYAQQADPARALRRIIRMRHYRRFLRQSGYSGGS